MIYLVENKNWDIVEDYNLDKLLYLLIDRPNMKTDYYCFWSNSAKNCHRDYDLPADVLLSEDLKWCIDGCLYRKNKNHTIYHPNCYS